GSAGRAWALPTDPRNGSTGSSTRPATGSPSPTCPALSWRPRVVNCRCTGGSSRRSCRGSTLPASSTRREDCSRSSKPRETGSHPRSPAGSDYHRRSGCGRRSSKPNGERGSGSRTRAPAAFAATRTPTDGSSTPTCVAHELDDPATSHPPGTVGASGSRFWRVAHRDLEIQNRGPVDRLQCQDTKVCRALERGDGHAVDSDRVRPVGGAGPKDAGQRGVRVSRRVGLQGPPVRARG